jgi:hypothetical protein
MLKTDDVMSELLIEEAWRNADAPLIITPAH